MTTTQVRSTPRNQVQSFEQIPPLESIVPWSVSDISARPYRGAWSMNPSVHFDGETWRCAIRCADYAMSGGTTVRARGSMPGYVVSRNAMLILDPATLRPIEIHLMGEFDGQQRLSTCPSVGFEDMRLFESGSGGLQAIAASLHLDRAPRAEPVAPVMYRPRGLRRTPERARGAGGRAKFAQVAQPAPGRNHVAGMQSKSGAHPPEQVLLSFDDRYNIIDAQPLRGAWSGRAQKNWSPFDRADEPMFLYSIDEGKVFGIDGPIVPEDPEKQRQYNPSKNYSGTEVRLMRQPIHAESGRGSRHGYQGLRGGTQLVHIGDRLDATMRKPVAGGGWIALAHDMRHVNGKKFYWHVLYLVDSTGELVGMSPTFKIDPRVGIEFAAGLAVDGDRAVISYGTEDMYCKLGVTSLDELLQTIVPLDDQETWSTNPQALDEFEDPDPVVDGDATEGDDPDPETARMPNGAGALQPASFVELDGTQVPVFDGSR